VHDLRPIEHMIPLYKSNDFGMTLMGGWGAPAVPRSENVPGGLGDMCVLISSLTFERGNRYDQTGVWRRLHPPGPSLSTITSS